MIRRKDGTILSEHGNLLDLSEQDLRETDFSGARVFGGDFSDADFRYSNFSGAQIKSAWFYHANCSACDFTGAVLMGVSLTRVNLDDAIFVDAKLIADSIGVRCNLKETDLRFTTLGNVVVEGCTYDRLTLFPDGFDPVARGMILED